MEIRNTPKGQEPEKEPARLPIKGINSPQSKLVGYGLLAVVLVLLLFYAFSGREENAIEAFARETGITEMRQQKQYAKAIENIEAAILTDSLKELRPALISLKQEIQEEAQEDAENLPFSDFNARLDSLSDYYAYEEALRLMDDEIARERYNSVQIQEIQERRALTSILWERFQSGQPVLLPKDYRVQAGETLSGIATHAGLSLSQVRQRNSLAKDNIMEGQILRLQDSVRVGTHQVKSGEALSLIAGKYAMSLRDIRRLNDLETDALKAGQELYIFLPLE